MRDTDLYTRIPGIEVPWQVSSVKVEMAKEEVIVQVERKVGAKLRCPTCGRESQCYDSRRRWWRHLDTCQYKTILEVDVPRVECPWSGDDIGAMGGAEFGFYGNVRGLGHRLVEGGIHRSGIAADRKGQ
uniref:Zinc-finger of transposase IS204/IS1001/IS1096/IS1165 n=1 Tax=Candidatus Kentrum sp. FW TaxID=2126338 RepID=A0A450T9Z6_9GAMM|nr:MAG: zinc-finger of transposase IS204/IS1001/IS1096/IS1165 [Candidatus Kentron sp. FW]